MSRFEFLRDITIGQYLPLGSWLHRLDPRAKLLAYTLLLLTLTFTPRPLGLVLALVCLLVLLKVARIPLGYALRGLLSPLPFLLILAALQVLINPHHGVSPAILQIGTFSITQTDLLNAALIILRFSVIILELSLTSFTLSTNELTQGMSVLLNPLAKIGLPVHDLVLIIQVALRFLPTLAQTAEQIAKAQASRGANWEVRGFNLIQRARQVIPLLVPLFVTSLHQAESLALAMDARGYTGGAARSARVQLRFSRQDWLALGTAVLLSVLFFCL